MYVTVPVSGYGGQTLVIKVWVLLGTTGMNWNLSVNNAIAWNTVGGKTFTSSDGLNTSGYTQLSFTFVCPSSSNFNLHVGSHGNTNYGQAAQVAGTSFVYGWQILVKNTTSALASNLSVDGTVAMTGTLTGPTGSFSNLAVSSASNVGALTCTSLTVGGNGVPTKLSGSISATTTFQTIYTLTSPTRGIITAVSRGGTYPSMMTAFFEWYSGSTVPSLTQLASSGNTTQAGINTTNVGAGTQYIALQMTQSNPIVIQAKATSNSFTLNWFVTLL
jgi:hypothetical protein